MKLQSKKSQERIKRVGRKAVNGGESLHLGNNGLRVRQVEEVNDRLNVPTFIHHELAGEAQVQEVDTGQALNTSRLQNDCFRPLIEAGEYFCRLKWQTGVVLEIDAGSDFPGQLIGAVYLEYIGGILVEEIVSAVDCLIGVIEDVEQGGIGKSGAAKHPLPALEGESFP